jgi:hypothetical protein
MSKRLAVFVDDDIPDKLLALADGPRKQGDFLSVLVRSAWEHQQVSRGATLDSLRLQMVGVIAELQELKGRIAAIEGKVSRLR